MDGLLKNGEKLESFVVNYPKEYEVKALKRRWYILAVFIYYGAVNSYQWIEYSSVTNIIIKYYNVSTIACNWTSNIYMAVYPFWVIPASYIIDKYGLRVTALIGCIGTAIGTTVKVFSVGRTLFPVVLLGQGIVSSSQVLMLCLPPKIAAIWFKTTEISTACALGVFGTQLGCAIGFLLTPWIVVEHENPEDIGPDLKVMCWGLAISMIPPVIAVLAYFPKYPPKPPSVTQAKERDEKPKFKTSTFFKSIGDLFLNKGFVLHMIGYSISIGVFSGVGTLLTEFILEYFPGQDKDAGAMGFVMVLIGMVGSIIFGIILDKTRRYKEVTVFIYASSVISVIILMYALEYRSKIASYIACGIVGLFTSSYASVGFEMAMELTFPSEEGTTTGILMAMTQIAGVFCSMGLGYFNKFAGPYWSLASQAALLVIGTITTILIPNDLRRQAAFAQNRDGFGPVSQNEKK